MLAKILVVVVSAAVGIGSAFAQVQLDDVSVSLTFDTSPGPLKPTPITIDLGRMGNAPVEGQEQNSPFVPFSANERLWIHLPGFAGGWNDLRSSIQAYAADGTLVQNAFTEAEWDPLNERLRLHLAADIAAGGLQTLKLGTRAMFTALDAAILNGLGPLPPRGGMDAEWTKFAWIRRYFSIACSGGQSGGVEVCTSIRASGAVQLEYLFSSSTQTFTTQFSRLPTQLVGPTGTIARPDFVYTAAGGSTDTRGLDNCITVTFVSSVTFKSTVDRQVFVTISGLSPENQRNADNFEMPVYENEAQCRLNSGRQIARYDERVFLAIHGTLTLRMAAPSYLVAGEVHSLTFRLNNPNIDHASKKVSIAASGLACLSGYKCEDLDTETRTIDVKEIPSDNILQSRAPNFRVKKIFQQRNDPNQDTVIFVTLRPSIQISGTDAITIKGLCGTDRNTETIRLVTTAGTDPEFRGSLLDSPVNPIGTAALAGQSWRRDSNGELQILPTTAGFRRDVLYAFGWVWRTKNEDNSACTRITISVGNRIEEELMDNVGNTVGLVLGPQFTTLKIGQITTRPAANNYICVTLKANADFTSQADADGEFIRGVLTISGLRGSSTPSTSSSMITRCPNGVNSDGELTVDGVTYDADTTSTAWQTWTRLPNSGGARVFRVPTSEADSNDFSYSAAPGIATLTLDNDFVMKMGIDYVFALNLQNGQSTQDCQIVQLRSSSAEFGQPLSTMEQTIAGRALQDGAEDGDACVGRTYSPMFIIRTVAQSNPLAGDSNVITVSLRPNVIVRSFDDGFTSVITLSGFSGTLTNTATLVQTNEVGQYPPSFSRLEFDQTQGSIKARVAAGTCQTPQLNNRNNNVCLLPGFTYVFRFTITNPSRSQVVPNIRVSASYNQLEPPMAFISIDSPPSVYKRALHILPSTDVMKTFKIGQVSPAPGPQGRNALCVTLATWIDWSVVEDVGQTGGIPTVTIRGLQNRFATSSNDLFIYHPETAGEFGNVALSANPGVAGAAMRNRDPARMIGTTTWQNQPDSKVRWNKNTGEVSFFLDNVRAEREFAFCILLTNENIEQTGSCDDVSLSVNVPGRGSSTYTMTQDRTKTVEGYGPGSSCVGTISARTFVHATLRSSSNVTRAHPVYFLELRPNAVVTRDQVVEIAGLDGLEPLGGMTGNQEQVPIQVVRNGRQNLDTFEDEAIMLAATGKMRLSVKDPASIPSFDHVSQRFCTTLPISTAQWRASCQSSEEPVFLSISFTLENGPVPKEPGRVTVTVAQSISQLVTAPTFPSTLLDTGRSLAPTRRVLPRSMRRDGHGELAFTLVTSTHIYGGETLIIDLPHHSMDVTGEIFGVQSTGSDAFSTFQSAAALRDSATPGEAARAFFTPGFVADAVTDQRASGHTGPGLDGFFVLSEDDVGRTEDKSGWHVYQESLWIGTFRQLRNAVVNTADGDPVAASVEPYTWNENFFTLYFTLIDDSGNELSTIGQVQADPRYRVFMDSNNLHGTVVSCSVPGDDQTRMVLAHNFVNLENRFQVALFVERGFLESDGTLRSPMDCDLRYKQRVGRYTGMRGMVSRTEVVFKQGAGPLYFVSDGSGVAPRYEDLSKQPYTIYSRIEIVAKKDADVPPGTEITVTIPNVLFPRDMQATVTVDSEETIESKTTLAVALITQLAGATSPRQGNLTGSFSFELPEMRPFLGPSTYPSPFLRSMRGLFVDFFGAMSLQASGMLTNETEVEVRPADYDSGNSSFWNTVTLEREQTFFATRRTENWAGAPVLFGLTDSKASPPRNVQLRIAADVGRTRPGGTQEVRFRGWQDGVPSPDRRRTGLLRYDRDSIEPLALPGRHYADGEFQSSANDNSEAATTIDLIARQSPVYLVSEVGNMIGMDGYDAMFNNNGNQRQEGDGHAIAAQTTIVRQLVTNWVPARASQRDASFLYQVPKLIDRPVANTVWTSAARKEPTVTYHTETGAVQTTPPQMFSANIRAMILLEPQMPLPAERAPLVCSLLAEPETYVLGDATEVDLTEINDIYPCGVNLDTPTFDLGYVRGTVQKLTILSRASQTTKLRNSNINIEDIASDIVRIEGTPDLLVELTFLFKSRERRLLQTCAEGTEFRIVELGVPRTQSCDRCNAFCPGPADCRVGPGEWVMVEMPTTVCNPPDESENDNTGAIVGGVVGGTLGVLLALLLCWLLLRDDERNRDLVLPPSKPMAPVFIPDDTAILHLDVLPNPAPLPGPEYATPTKAPYPLSAVPMQPTVNGGSHGFFDRAPSVPPPSVMMPASAQGPVPFSAPPIQQPVQVPLPSIQQVTVPSGGHYGPPIEDHTMTMTL